VIPPAAHVQLKRMLVLRARCNKTLGQELLLREELILSALKGRMWSQSAIPPPDEQYLINENFPPQARELANEVRSVPALRQSRR
jgi:hypothetical protein